MNNLYLEQYTALLYQSAMSKDKTNTQFDLLMDEFYNVITNPFYFEFYLQNKKDFIRSRLCSKYIELTSVEGFTKFICDKAIHIFDCIEKNLDILDLTILQSKIEIIPPRFQILVLMSSSEDFIMNHTELWEEDHRWEMIESRNYFSNAFILKYATINKLSYYNKVNNLDTILKQKNCPYELRKNLFIEFCRHQQIYKFYTHQQIIKFISLITPDDIPHIIRYANITDTSELDMCINKLRTGIPYYLTSAMRIISYSCTDHDFIVKHEKDLIFSNFMEGLELRTIEKYFMKIKLYPQQKFYDELKSDSSKLAYNRIKELRKKKSTIQSINNGAFKSSNMTIELLEKHKEYINWGHMSRKLPCSKLYPFEEYAEKFDWEWLSKKGYLTLAFCEKYVHYLLWEHVKNNKKVARSFYDKFATERKLGQLISQIL